MRPSQLAASRSTAHEYRSSWCRLSNRYGAVDYVVKPFSPTELVARIQAALRRRLPPVRVEPDEPYVLGNLIIDYAERLVASRVMTYDRLLRRVGGLLSSENSRQERAATKKFRRKLGEDPSSPTCMVNEPRLGYRMAKGEEPEQAMPYLSGPTQPPSSLWDFSFPYLSV